MSTQKLTVEFLIEFSNQTKTDQASYFANQLKDVVFVTNKNSYYVFDEQKKLFVEQNEGQYYTYFCDYINTFVKKVKDLQSKIKCICDDDDKECNCGAKFKRRTLANLIKDFDTKTYLKDISERSYGKLYDTEFDKRINNVHHLLPIKNGKIIDLKTLQVRQRTINDKFTFECPVSFVEGEQNIKHADKFFCDIMPDKKEREFLQKCLGYMLTGEVDARAFFIWYGNGSNGKSVIVNLLLKILDKFYVSADKSVFCKTDNKNSGAASPHLYALLGKRMIGYSEGETSDQFELNFSVLKQISGDDEISCRGLYKDQITFKSSGKLNFLTNYVPRRY
jgi:phage/plasmid-associated DNA primase